MENDNMDFSSYDQYLKKFDEVIGSPEGIDEPETERMMEIPDVSSPEPLAQPAETQPAGETKESADDRYKVVPPDGIDFMSEESPAPSVSENENDEEERAEKKIKAISKFEVLMMAGKMAEISDMVNAWAEKLIEIRDHSEKRLPKGIRISIHRLKEMEDILRAVKTILETFTTMDFTKALQTMEQNKLLSFCKMASKNLKDEDDNMISKFTELKEVIGSDNPEARTKAREMKLMVLSVHSEAEKIGKSFVNTLFDYPDENEELAVFSVIADKGIDATHIDRAFMALGERAVHVADAPAMIKARKEKDNKTMIEILERIIEF